MTLPISVIIPTMNRPNTLMDTIKSICLSSSLPNEVIIIDQSQNESDRKGNLLCVDVLKVSGIKASYSELLFPSSTKARNIGQNLATNDILVYCDDDINVYYDTFKNIYDLMRNCEISMIAAIDDCSIEKTLNFFSYLFVTRSFLKRKMGHVTMSMLGCYPSKIKGQIKTEWAMGYFFAVKKSLINQWGIVWDEKLMGYAYAEDLDFSYAYYKKSKKMGLRCIIDERVRVKHLVSTEYRVPSKENVYKYVVNRLYLWKKHEKSLFSLMSLYYTNLGMLLRSIILRNHPNYWLLAIIKSLGKYKLITKGDFKD